MISLDHICLIGKAFALIKNIPNFDDTILKVQFYIFLNLILNYTVNPFYPIQS